MGNNIDLQWLLNLPDRIKCPNCNNLVKTDFEEYDIDCGDPNVENEIMALDCHCDICDEYFKYKIKIKPCDEEK